MSQGTFRGGLPTFVQRLAAGLLAAGLVTGCTTSDDEPSPTVEPTTAAPEPEPEPTEDVPEEPEAPLPPTGTPDERDAEAAGEFFVRLYEYTLTTGDTEQWEQRSHEDCGFCRNVLDAIRENEQTGARFTDVRIEGGDGKYVAFEEVLVVFLVEVPYKADEMKLVDGNGSTLRTFTAEEGFLLMDVAYEPRGGWQLLSGGSHEESQL